MNGGHGDPPHQDSGQGRPPSNTRSRPKSIGHETTFERDVIDPAVWERTLWRLTEDACRRLRAADLRTRQVTLKIRYSDFFTLTHGGPLSEATDVDSVVYRRALELFHEGNTRRLRIRLLGVRLERLCVGASQGLLFESHRDRRAHEFYAAVDCIRERHGRDCLCVGPGVFRLGERRSPYATSTAGIQTGFMHGR
jgi:DNA polymerase-4